MSVWSHARDLAERTPPSRNRYVDFLRAASIGAVVFGHWLIAAPWISPEGLRLEHMLAVKPWTQWLTLVFQVMPIFFLVGGYSNASSWTAARREGVPYGAWVAGRARRLIGPIVPLILTWAVLALVFRAFGVRPEAIREGSMLALVPMWFLAVYLFVVMLVPVTRAAWERFGIASFWMLVVAAIGVDWLRFHDGHWPAIGWLNYALIWVAMHQLGYLWRDGRMHGLSALPWALGGATAWALLAKLGPYPISMVGVPGEEVSNTLPPDLMLLALGMAQAGALLAIEAPMRRWLARASAWTATVAVNGTIMTVYLWHLTVLTLAVGLASLAGGVGLGFVPGSRAWWLARVPWFAVLALGMTLVLPLVGRFERSAPLPPEFRPSLPRILAGAALVSAGIALLALGGIGTAEGLGVRAVVVAGTIGGTILLGAFSLRRSPPSRARAALVVVALSGAGFGAAAPGVAFEFSSVVESYAVLVHRSYAAALNDARTLEQRIAAFLDDPREETLAAARASWLAARITYGQTEAFRFYGGPIEVDPRTFEPGPELQLNAWPLDEAFIDGVRGRPDAGIVHDPSIVIDRAALSTRNGADDETHVTTGYHAIEFLLWGQDLDQAGPGRREAGEFAPGDPVRERRREYLRVVAALVVTDLEGLVQAWRADAPGNFASAWRASAPAESIDRAFTGLVRLTGFEMAFERLAVALDSGDQEDEHSCFSDNTHADFIANARGVRNVWTGRLAGYTGTGLREAVRAAEPSLVERIDRELERVDAGVSKLPRPFDRLLSTAPGSDERRNAENLVKSLRRLADLLDLARVRAVAVARVS